MPARLHVLMAREAPRAVILRRGPSDRVCLVAWDLSRDRFEVGQWIRGRVYERRCDLSPSGELMLAFVSQYRKPMQTWTAVSRVPYFTALALWPNGTTWGGGGLFDSEKRIRLNHGASQMALSEGLALPQGVQVEPFGDRSGRGEDEPVWTARLERDGWVRTVQGQFGEYDRDGSLKWTAEIPPTWIKRSPLAVLEMRWVGVGQRNGPWYLLDYTLVHACGDRLELGRLDWAELSERSDLLFARDGKLFRLAIPKAKGAVLASARELIDLNPLTFEPKPAPPEALRWPERVTRRTPRG